MCFGVLGSDLQAAGVNITSISDPTSFRLFTAGGRAQERDLTPARGYLRPGRVWMDEIAIDVQYGGDGTFDPGDRIVFAGRFLRRPGSTATAPALRATPYYRHQYTPSNFYYLSWDDTGFSGSPGAHGKRRCNPGRARLPLF